MSIPCMVAQFDFEAQKIEWKCYCGKRHGVDFEVFTFMQTLDRKRSVICECGELVYYDFLRSVYSIKLQEQILQEIRQGSRPIQTQTKQ
jgi:hypothetical protein